MPYQPITTLEIENYGCIKKAKFELTPLHAFIGPNDGGKSTILRALRERLSTVNLVRFDSDSLRAPGTLIPESDGIRFLDERGAGLPGVLDAIINRDAAAFAQLQTNLRRLFPNVAKLGLINLSESLKEVAVTLTDGTRVSAKEMSDGLLYYLGFAALPYITDCRLFLVEAPERGLHPVRVPEVMATLRELSKRSQVVIATHSPLVVNELSGDEVTVVTRDPDTGTRGLRLKDVPCYEASSKVYRPGELWLTYADGELEEPLLMGRARP